MKLLLPLFVASSLAAQPVITPVFWPDKNGPTFDGHVPAADAAKLPTEWDEASGKNIAWKTVLPAGRGWPLVACDRRRLDLVHLRHARWQEAVPQRL